MGAKCSLVQLSQRLAENIWFLWGREEGALPRTSCSFFTPFSYHVSQYTDCVWLLLGGWWGCILGVLEDLVTWQNSAYMPCPLQKTLKWSDRTTPMRWLSDDGRCAVVRYFSHWISSYNQRKLINWIIGIYQCPSREPQLGKKIRVMRRPATWWSEPHTPFLIDASGLRNQVA